MAIIYMNGAETQYATAIPGGWENADGVSVNTNTAYVRSGAASFRVNPSNQSPWMYAGSSKDPNWAHATYTARYASFHMYIATLPGSSQYFYLACTMTGAGSNKRWSARLRNDGKVECGQHGGSQTVSSAALSTATWYQVSIKFPGASQTGSVTVRDMSGTTIASCSAATSGDAVEYAMAFCYAAGSYGDIYVDNYVVDPAADPYTALTASYAVNMLKVTADGGGNWEDNDYAKVDEVPPSTTDYDYNTVATWNTETKQVRWAMENTWGASQRTLTSIAAAQATALDKVTAANGDAYDYVGFYIGSTYYFGSARGGNNAFMWITRCLETDPSDSAAWTAADLDAAQAAMQAYHNHTSSQLYVYCYFACIEYVGPCQYATVYTSTPSGAISTLTGAIARNTKAPLSGALATITGALSKVHINVLALAGALTPSGSLARKAGKAVAGALTSAGEQTIRWLTKFLYGDLTPVASLARLGARLMEGGLTLAAEIARKTQRPIDSETYVMAETSRGPWATTRSLTAAISSIVGAVSGLRIVPRHLRAAGRPLHLNSNRRGERDRDVY
jgi:hypothetical protein